MPRPQVRKDPHACKHGRCKRKRAIKKIYWEGRLYEYKELSRCFPHLLYCRKQAKQYQRKHAK